jgi:hypothetical protein
MPSTIKLIAENLCASFQVSWFFIDKVVLYHAIGLIFFGGNILKMAPTIIKKIPMLKSILSPPDGLQKYIHQENSLRS